MEIIDYIREKISPKIPIEGVVEKIEYDYVGIRDILFPDFEKKLKKLGINVHLTRDKKNTIYSLRVGEEIILIGERGDPRSAEVGDTIKGHFIKSIGFYTKENGQYIKIPYIIFPRRATSEEYMVLVTENGKEHPNILKLRRPLFPLRLKVNFPSSESMENVASMMFPLPLNEEFKDRYLGAIKSLGDLEYPISVSHGLVTDKEYVEKAVKGLEAKVAFFK